MNYTIRDDFINKIEVKKSVFITYLYKVYDIESCNNLISKIKEKHSDATHCCYAYIIDNYQKASDDGEPSNTAGIPILEVLKKNKINYCLAVVVRYFGGIKLGAGGLIRTYSLAAKEALNLCNRVSLIDGYRVLIELDYNQIDKLEYLLKENSIVEKNFDEKLSFIVDIEEEDLNKINSYNYSILEKRKIEKDL
ncbi:MAG: YigZ family protein [Bacilli bacterium]|nr:YigZ family protein [Bacilli bacterium]